MAKYWHNDVEIADIQAVESLIKSKLNYYKSNYPYAYREIVQMQDALNVLNDIEYDLNEEELYD